ncbi:MAG: 50S ribosomal protein L25 [Longimicrobiales bacterium]|nr:50S ribosomal protein L25 [Longimicrobiales bacterium]
MSTRATLKAESRDAVGKGVARKLRASGRVPGVVYGQGDEALLLSLDAHETGLLFNNISVENTIVALEVAGEKEPIDTLVREVQVHPFRPDILHVDFYRVQKGVELEVNVPFHLHGNAPGVKNHGGVLQQLHHDLPVRTIPSLIPDEVIFDVSGLEINDQVLAGELVLPEGVTLELDPETTLVVVSPPRLAAEDEEDEDAEEPAEPELIGHEEGDDGTEGA